MTSSVDITVAYGDGIGPEIMEAVLLILKEAQARINIQTVVIGEQEYLKGYTSGISSSSWEAIQRNKILLKAPITTPQGGGYKSLNVTIRKHLGLYANIRPCKSLYPYVDTKHPEMDIVMVRENEEDLYAGIEYRQTHNAYHSIKLLSRTGSERIARYAFEYAKAHNRKKVTCLSKDNIMKFTDGMFHQVFDQVAAEYPEIENEHYIVDIGAARIATKPQTFDVLVTENLYGDIISDIIAEISGSIGLAGSANIGDDFAMFEAIHGSAPKYQGQDYANPSGLLQAAIMMLVHIGQPDVASTIQNAWLKTLEDGVHTADIYNDKTSSKKVGTKAFALAVVERLGQSPKKLSVADYKEMPKTLKPVTTFKELTKAKKDLVGVDVFVSILTNDLAGIANRVEKFADRELRMQFISLRGSKVWPTEGPVTKAESDHWRIRFVSNTASKVISHDEIVYLLGKFHESGIDFIKTENLYIYDGKELGFSLAQGE